MKNIARNSFDLARQIIDMPDTPENRNADVEAWAPYFDSPVCPPGYCLAAAKQDPEENRDILAMAEDFWHVEKFAESVEKETLDPDFVLLRHSPYHHEHFWREFSGEIVPGEIYTLKNAGIFDPPAGGKTSYERWRQIYNFDKGPILVVASGKEKDGGYFAAMPVVLNWSAMNFWYPGWLPRAEAYPGIETHFADKLNFDNLTSAYVANVRVFVPRDHVLEKIGWLRGDTPVKLFGDPEAVFVPDPDNKESWENKKREARLRLYLMWMDAKNYQRNPKPKI